MRVPTTDELKCSYEAFQFHEARDPVYKVASFLLEHYWGHPAEMANGLGVLLLTWSQARYRYGNLDFGKLEECIARNMDMLNRLRKGTILDLTDADHLAIKELFEQFLAALAIAAAKGSRKGAQSPVAVAKALQLLAPGFFPLWDKKDCTGIRM
jgi:hypothetical protein